MPMLTGMHMYVSKVIIEVQIPMPSAPWARNFLEYLAILSILVDISSRLVKSENSGARVKQGEKRQRKPN